MTQINIVFRILCSDMIWTRVCDSSGHQSNADGQNKQEANQKGKKGSQRIVKICAKESILHMDPAQVFAAKITSHY